MVKTRHGLFVKFMWGIARRLHFQLLFTVQDWTHRPSAFLAQRLYDSRRSPGQVPDVLVLVLSLGVVNAHIMLHLVFFSGLWSAESGNRHRKTHLCHRISVWETLKQTFNHPLRESFSLLHVLRNDAATSRFWRLLVIIVRSVVHSGSSTFSSLPLLYERYGTL